ncbi:MAG: serine hydrolase, partial [Pseudomonadota bacterium]
MAGLTPLPPQPEGVEWPIEAWPEHFESDAFDRERLAALLDEAFAAPETEAYGETHAFLAVHRGAVVAERYAEGRDVATTFPSWSKAKSITQALIGILVREGQIDVHAPADVPEWQGTDDPRKEITLDQLLRMSSGLQFAEDYIDAGVSDVIEM